MGATHFNMLVGLITGFNAFNVMLVHAGGPAKNPFSELAAIDNKYFAPKACPIGTAMSMKGGVRHCVKCSKVCIKLLYLQLTWCRFHLGSLQQRWFQKLATIVGSAIEHT